MDFLGKDKKKKERQVKKQNKREEKIKIHKDRTQNSEFVLTDKGWFLRWKERLIGRYIKAGNPPMMETFAQEYFRWKPVDIVINKPTNLKYIELKDKFYII